MSDVPPMTGPEPKLTKMDERHVDAFTRLVSILKPLSFEEQCRVVDAVIVFLGISDRRWR